MTHICGALRDLLPFLQLKKREKDPWASATFSKVTLLHECFSRFLNCTNGTKSRNAPHLLKKLLLENLVFCAVSVMNFVF